jgi:hypothetical protein
MRTVDPGQKSRAPKLCEAAQSAGKAYYADLLTLDDFDAAYS